VFSVAKTVLAFQVPFNGIEPLLAIMHKLVVLSGLIGAWFGCNALVRYCMNKNWFVWLSAFSFMIYVLHAPIVVFATKALFIQISDWFGYRMLTFILLPFCLITFSVITGALLRRFLPGVYSFVTGGRGLG
jgi:membrane-bound acyltransferase YfiQ involved in biofilm formation